MKLKFSLLLVMVLLGSGKLLGQATMTTEQLFAVCSAHGHFVFEINPSNTFIKLDINFGDGSPVETYYTMDFSRQYDVSGTYAITATVYYSVPGSPPTTATAAVTGSITLTAPMTSLDYAGFAVSGSGYSYSFNYTGLPFSGDSYTLDFGDGTTFSGTGLTTGQLIASHTYLNYGTYVVKLSHHYFPPGTDRICSWVEETAIVAGTPPPPDLCCSNFSPESGKEYWLSAWVQEAVASQVTTYSNKVYVELEFTGSFAGSQYVRLYPSEDIVENWQRIVGRFTVPAGTTQIQIHTVNDNDYLEAYFDDVRIHPFNGSMKSYVYDPFTLLLTAELDDNNYATFYEYDKEGQLIRIKKETARGIMTIQESRSSNPKKSN